MQNVSTFLMFDGKAEEAMNLYTSVIPNSAIGHITRYQAGEQGQEGSVMHASFTLNGQLFSCIDSPIKHSFGFTPAVSIYLTCSSEAELDDLYLLLSEGGSVLMPLGPYPFSKKYAWLSDRFGVSWQLSM